MSDHANGNGEQGQLIPAEPDDKLPVGQLLAPFIKPNNTVCSVNFAAGDAKATYISMKNGESKPLADAANTVIEVVHFFFEPKRKIDATTGEVSQYPRFVLRCADGSQYSGGAFSIMAAIADLLLFRPNAPWEPPERVKVVVKNLPGGKRIYNLIPVADEAPPAPKKGGK